LFLGFCLGSGLVDPYGCGQFRGLGPAAEAFGVRRVRLGEGDGSLLADEVSGAEVHAGGGVQADRRVAVLVVVGGE
jgi:hypothetical protein